MPKKIDNNQNEVVKKIRNCGVSVLILSAVGNGSGDILCGIKKKNYFFEIKNPDMPESKRRLTSFEEQFHNSWRGQIDVIETAEEALEIMGVR